MTRSVAVLTALIAALLADVVLLAGCGDDGGGTASADCTTQVRVGDAVYSGYGSTAEVMEPWREAEVAECHDTGVVGGQEPQGSVFTGEGDRVQTWTVEGYEPQQVIAVRHRRDQVEVFVSDDLTEKERDRIISSLRD